MTTSPLVSVFALALPLVAAAPALAQGTDAQRAACSGDAFRLCASSIPNAEKTAACLRREKAQLSPACRGVFDAAENGGRNGKTDAENPATPARTAEEPASAPAAAAPRAARARANEQDAPKSKPADARSASKLAAGTRSVAARRSAPSSGTKQARRTAPSVKPAATRQAVFIWHGVRTHRDSDMAQARYWMQRVTGISIGNLAGLLPN